MRYNKGNDKIHDFEYNPPKNIIICSKLPRNSGCDWCVTGYHQDQLKTGWNQLKTEKNQLKQFKTVAVAVANILGKQKPVAVAGCLIWAQKTGLDWMWRHYCHHPHYWARNARNASQQHQEWLHGDYPFLTSSTITSNKCKIDTIIRESITRASQDYGSAVGSHGSRVDFTSIVLPSQASAEDGKIKVKFPFVVFPFWDGAFNCLVSSILGNFFSFKANLFKQN